LCQVTNDASYDNPNSNTNSVAPPNGPHGLAGIYPQFKTSLTSHILANGPTFDTTRTTPNGLPQVGKCWKFDRHTDGRMNSFHGHRRCRKWFQHRKWESGDTMGSSPLEAEAIVVPGRRFLLVISKSLHTLHVYCRIFPQSSKCRRESSTTKSSG
jgi:hypothetical protein